MTTASRYRDLRDQGLTESKIRWRCEQGRLIRPFHGTYLDGTHPDGACLDDTAVSHGIGAGLTAAELARLQALFVRLPADAVAGLQTAAHLHGFGGFAPRREGITVLVPAGTPRPRIRGVRAYETVLPIDPVLVSGVPCAPAARCAIDLARTSRRLDALPVLDGAVGCGACSPDDLVAELDRHARLRGVCQVRELLRYVDPGAQCRQESQLRLVVVDGRLPRPQTQLRVIDDFDQVRYILDLGWEEHRVGAEYDGVSHLDRDRARHDRERHNWLAGQGWRMRYFTDLDLYRRPRHILSVLSDVLC